MGKARKTSKKKAKRSRKVDEFGQSPAKRTTPRTRAVPTIKKREPEKLGFADMPGEIRNNIYEYALMPSNGKAVRLTGGSKVGGDLVLGLMATCKAVRKEATSFFYQENTFRIENLKLHQTLKLDHKFTWKMIDPHPKFPLWDRTLEGWTDHAKVEDRARPRQVLRTLRSMGPKNVANMRTVVFALHPQYPDQKDASKAITFPETPGLWIELQLLRRAPHYSLRVREELSSSKHLVKAWERGYCGYMRVYVHSQIQGRALRSLSNQDVMELADVAHQ